MLHDLQISVNDINKIVKYDIKKSWQLQHMKFRVIYVNIFCFRNTLEVNINPISPRHG